MKKNVKAGFNLTCVGDDRTYSYLESRYADTLADKVIQNVLKFHYSTYRRYSFLKSGSDERRYQSPGIDLPVVCFSRSLYGEYPEYHTSADDMSLISPAGLQGSFNVMIDCITALENNVKYKTTNLCDPQLGRRGLYPTISRKGQYDEVFKMINFLAYADGTNDLIDISNIINIPVSELFELVALLRENNLIENV
jgi:aminopeptidase-like protein